MNKAQEIYLGILFIILSQTIIGFIFFESGIGVLFTLIDFGIVVVFLLICILYMIWDGLGEW